MVKIALLDDEFLFVEGVSVLLASCPNVKVTLAETDGLRFLSRMSEMLVDDIPDIVLLDIEMKPMDGFEVIERLRSMYSEIKIIILSSHYRQNVLGHMMKLGTSAFIPKNTTKAQLLEVIDAVHKNGLYFTTRDYEMLRSYLNTSNRRPMLSPKDKLSSREQDVLKLICQECTSQEIADKLYISVRTVESHRQHIMDKVGAKNTVGIVLYAIMSDIHPLPPMA
ncbi:response regulator [Sphingobacterium suaedae]|uniref:Response regulator n=1 Tax=Sphingobacterium suaedae TaxID=1686402 RepID=A0ABW5KL02_9SPHI